MAFKLERTNHGTWKGTVGETVKIDVRPAAAGTPAKAVRIAYAGAEDGDPPLEFEIKKGVGALLVAAIGVKNGQEVEIIEVDGAKAQVLRSFFWSKLNFFESVDIEGE